MRFINRKWYDMSIEIVLSTNARFSGLQVAVLQNRFWLLVYHPAGKVFTPVLALFAMENVSWHRMGRKQDAFARGRLKEKPHQNHAYWTVFYRWLSSDLPSRFFNGQIVGLQGVPQNGTREDIVIDEGQAVPQRPQKLKSFSDKDTWPQQSPVHSAGML